MKTVLTDDRHYTNIANKIREKTGRTTKYKPSEMPSGLEEVYSKGYSVGKQSEYDAFWDTYQQNGNREKYGHAFAGAGWNDNTFNPKYSLTPSNCYMMFSECNIADIQTAAERSGITIDFSNATSLLYLLYMNGVTKRIGVVDTKSASDLYGVFQAAYGLNTIDKLILYENSPALEVAFNGCESLKNLTIEGVISKDGLNLSYSLGLTHESLMSVINTLKDYSGSSDTHTVTLGSTNLAKLSNAEKAIATQKGWSLA